MQRCVKVCATSGATTASAVMQGYCGISGNGVLQLRNSLKSLLKVLNERCEFEICGGTE